MDNTQIEQVRIHLKRGKTLTPLEALDMYGSLRLSSIIHTLRNEGMNISMMLNEGKKKYAIYQLVPPDGQITLGMMDKIILHK